MSQELNINAAADASFASKYQENTGESSWGFLQKGLFRIAFIYFVLQIVPLDWKFYRHLFSINWLNTGLAEIFQLSKYTPQFISGAYDPWNWGMATFSDWTFILAVAVLGSIIWTALEKKPADYPKLYGWLRILVRYRLAVAVIAYGFLKLFALQSPLPSISSLNTPYGDFTTWKLFSLSLGIVPGYQAFLGAVELTAGILLLFRRTSVIGATIIIFFTGNVFMSNLAYEGGEVVYSFFLVTLALFLVIYDAQRIISLIVLHIPVAPAKKIALWPASFKPVRLVLKSLVILVFVVIYGFSAQRAARQQNFHFSGRKGIKGLSGLYNVSSFKLNGQEHPYDLTDPLRWQNVVFENWGTLSVKINKRDTVLDDNVESVPLKGSARLFEASGTRGRQYYTFTADTVTHTLVLQDPKHEHNYQVENSAGTKNEIQSAHNKHLEEGTQSSRKTVALSVPELGSAETAGLAGSVEKGRLAGKTATNVPAGNFTYTATADGKVLLSGALNGNQLEVVLEKSDKKYLLKEAEKGRSKKLKL